MSLPATDKTEVLGLVSPPYPKVSVVYYGPLQAVGAAVARTWLIIKGTLVYIWQMVTGASDMSQLRGPVGVAGVAGKIASFGIVALIELAALMSVSIGLINLFPFRSSTGAIFCTMDARLCWGGRSESGPRTSDFGLGWRWCLVS